MASQPHAIMSAKAVFPEPRAPMIATSPGLNFKDDVSAHSALSISIDAITCEGGALIGECSPTKARPAGSMHACRKESKLGVPLIHEYRFSVGVPMASWSWASQPCRHGFTPP